MEGIEKISIEPALYLVATPIGNLRDITLRALDILNSADTVLCEDTRVTKKLLDNYGIAAKLSVYNDHSKEAARNKIMAMIKQGKSIALVSDAGTPLISDPGYKLVRDCVQNNVKVTTAPGVSSVISALTLSSLPSDSFYFCGFLPQNRGQKENFLCPLNNINSTLIFMDRGSRLASTMQAILNIFGDVEVVIAREITKLYEEVIVKTSGDALSYCNENEIKGEVVILVNNSSRKGKKLSKSEIDEVLLDLLVDNSVRSASAIAFLEHGINKKLAYKRLLELKDVAQK